MTNDIELSVFIRATENKTVAEARILIKKPDSPLGFRGISYSWDDECNPSEMFCKIQPNIRELLEQIQNTPTPCPP